MPENPTALPVASPVGASTTDKVLAASGGRETLEYVDFRSGTSSRYMVLFGAFFLLVMLSGFTRFGSNPLFMVVIGFVVYMVAKVVLPRVDGWLLHATGARLVDDRSAPQVHNVVEEICVASGLEKPRIAVIDDPALNALAQKSKRPGGSIIVVTSGLLHALDRDELQGVIAHELTDLVYGPLGYLEAYDVAVHLTRNPAGLRRALEKVASGSAVVRRSPRMLRGLWFEYPSTVRPVDKRGDSIVPPLASRIAAMSHMTQMEGASLSPGETPVPGGDSRFAPPPAFFADRISSGSVARLGIGLAALFPCVFAAAAAYAFGNTVLLWFFIGVIGVIVVGLLRTGSRPPAARG